MADATGILRSPAAPGQRVTCAIGEFAEAVDLHKELVIPPGFTRSLGG